MWITNNAGYKFHNAYGFGAIDAKTAVEMASSYDKKLGDLLVNTYIVKSEDEENMGDTSKQDEIKFTINDEINLEAITLSYKVNYHEVENPFDNLVILVISPSNLSKRLNIPNFRKPNDKNQELKFTFNQFYGESAKGEWKFYFLYEHKAELIDMKMTIYGTKEDISKTSNP